MSEPTKTVVITGTSSGFGEGAVRDFADRGYRVWGTQAGHAISDWDNSLTAVEPQSWQSPCQSPKKPGHGELEYSAASAALTRVSYQSSDRTAQRLKAVAPDRSSSAAA